MFRLARFSLAKAKIPSGRVDTSSLSAQQLEEIREAVTRDGGTDQNADSKFEVGGGETGPKYILHKKTGGVHKRAKKEIRPFYWVRDGTRSLENTRWFS